MKEISFAPLTIQDLEELEKWHEDTILRGRYGGADWPQKMHRLMKDNERRMCYVAYEYERMIGYIDFEQDESRTIGLLGLVVNPTMRSIGYGTDILRAFLETDMAREVEEIRGGIEEDNIASIRCFEAAGFNQLSPEPDQEGCLNFSFSLKAES